MHLICHVIILRITVLNRILHMEDLRGLKLKQFYLLKITSWQLSDNRKASAASFFSFSQAGVMSSFLLNYFC